MKVLDIKNKIKIGYRNYDIKVEDKVWNKQTESFGQFLSEEGIITVSSKEDAISQANTLLHEILHGIVYQWGLGEEMSDKEEKIVNTLTNGLTTVFVDNPWLLQFLINKTKEGTKNEK